MTKLIKIQNNLRVRIKYNQNFKRYNLRLQRSFFFFWLNTDWFVDVAEGFWGEENYTGNPMKLSYRFGGGCEYYKTGTMNFKERAKKLCEDYLKEQRDQINKKKVLADL